MDAERLRRAAEAYTERLGWPVFPLHPITPAGRCACGGEGCAGKHPIPARWEHTIASTTAAHAAWRPEIAPRGIGVPTGGARIGAWVLDVDPATGGLDTLAELERTHGPLPETWRGRTGTGGEHYFWRAADDRVHNSASQVWRGLDVRGTGGYVVLPPSPHRNGTTYEWIHPPLRGPLADPPDWLLNLALTRPRRAGAGRRGRFTGEQAKVISAGKRHDALIRFCGLLRSCGLGEDAIVECGFALLRHHATPDPPMDLEQAERDMRDVARRYAPSAPAG
jgi:hypothetical protein